jgi:hypothetical protein
MPGLCSTTVDIVTPEVLLVVIMIWQIAMMFLSHKWGLTSFNRFWVYYRSDTHRFWLYTGLSTCIVTCDARRADHAYPSGAPDDIPGFCEVRVRVQSCLFVLSLLFLLSLFVQSLYCHIFGTMMFWIIRLVASVFVCRCLYNILLYLDQIALSMFHQ